MKAFFILSILLLSLTGTSFGQKKPCKLWLGDSYDSIALIKEMAEKYLEFNLKMTPNDENNKTTYELKDSGDFCNVRIWMKSKKVVVGTAITTLYFINSIKIVCISDRIETLFNALKEKVAECTSQSSKTGAIFSSGKMSVENQGGDWSKKNIPMSTLTISPAN